MEPYAHMCAPTEGNPTVCIALMFFAYIAKTKRVKYFRIIPVAIAIVRVNRRGYDHSLRWNRITFELKLLITKFG